MTIHSFQLLGVDYKSQDESKRNKELHWTLIVLALYKAQVVKLLRHQAALFILAHTHFDHMFTNIELCYYVHGLRYQPIDLLCRYRELHANKRRT
jgi:hypothetical protein